MAYPDIGRRGDPRPFTARAVPVVCPPKPQPFPPYTPLPLALPPSIQSFCLTGGRAVHIGGHQTDCRVLPSAPHSVRIRSGALMPSPYRRRTKGAGEVGGLSMPERAPFPFTRFETHLSRPRNATPKGWVRNAFRRGSKRIPA